MPTNTDDQLADLVRSYENAFNTNNARAMNDLFADEPVFVNFGGNLVRDKQALHRAQSFVFAPGGPLERISVSYTIENITHLAPDLAAVHARQRTRQDGADGQVAGEDPMAAILLLVAQRTNGEWRIRVGQNTPVT
ncbi:YybH family protein [Goodfellowiella coeruleoviolacea]|uniref:DUF4440 domain-containing protein n=1 Tax=Goodfellowiella coeruleoviolacea TaxID=334858 RepID=A0AAE3GH06_9PSEU|nr:SgcJ/EcaC family oxidoreductase [Goodfellowiella coeruleoviolacea]MCP2168092.1 hypothetical protein [Goodfellowiella coeruleoviolacea]